MRASPSVSISRVATADACLAGWRGDSEPTPSAAQNHGALRALMPATFCVHVRGDSYADSVRRNHLAP